MSSVGPAIAQRLWEIITAAAQQGDAQGRQQNDMFYGLFIYPGALREPPADTDAIVQTLQTSAADDNDSCWLVFADDSESPDCNCPPPFADCESGNIEENGTSASFCHLRFPLTECGTSDVVAFMVNDLVIPHYKTATAFICGYNRTNMLDEQSEPQAQVLSRFVVGKNNGENAASLSSSSSSTRKKDVLADQASLPTVGDIARTGRKTYRRLWIVALGLALLGAIIAIVTLVILRRKKQNLKKKEQQQRQKEAALIQQSTTALSNESAPTIVPQ